MSDAAARWGDAALAAALLAIDPAGLGGAVLRARTGPVLSRWLDLLEAWLPDGLPRRRIPPDIPDERLLGGLDLAPTLASGRPVWRAGMLAELDGGVAVLPMAERLRPGLAGRLSLALDAKAVIAERDGHSLRQATRFGLVLLDEGAEPEETVPVGLADRLAFQLSLEGLAMGTAAPPPWGAAEIAAARARLPEVALPEEGLAVLTQAAAAFGIDSLRAPLLAAAAARTIAALEMSETAEEAHLAAAARLVLGPRARQLPAEDTADAEPPPPPPDDDTPPEEDDTPESETQEMGLEEVVLKAVHAALPPDILAALAQGRAPRGSDAGRAGGRQVNFRRGRPAGTVAAAGRSGVRLDLLATLRAAAPWQPIRRKSATSGARSGLSIRHGDLQAKRFVTPSESLLIFAVDASGSTAAARLAEAKGAVELMLAQSYARRDQVALVAFRGTGAEVLLPPTRSLTRAKRLLAGLPGGGGTPVAAGLVAAHALARQARHRGATPYLAALTDGRGNIALDGTPGRPEAAKDAADAAARISADGISAVVIDTGRRPHPAARELADAMGARYVALPRADASALESAIRSAAP